MIAQELTPLGSRIRKHILDNSPFREAYLYVSPGVMEELHREQSAPFDPREPLKVWQSFCGARIVVSADEPYWRLSVEKKAMF